MKCGLASLLHRKQRWLRLRSNSTRAHFGREARSRNACAIQSHKSSTEVRKACLVMAIRERIKRALVWPAEGAVNRDQPRWVPVRTMAFSLALAAEHPVELGKMLGKIHLSETEYKLSFHTSAFQTTRELQKREVPGMQVIAFMSQY